MTWLEYVAWTSTTALPAASDPAYLRLGLIEEAHEFLAAYASMQAAQYGLEKRMLRGDSEQTLEAKQSAIATYRQQALRELGDMTWYLARLDSLNGMSRPRADLVDWPGERYIAEFSGALHTLQQHTEHLTILALGFFMVAIGAQLIEATPEEIFAANVAKLTARQQAGTIKGAGSDDIRVA